MYMKKQYKSSITKNHKIIIITIIIIIIIIINGVPFKGYVAS